MTQLNTNWPILVVMLLRLSSVVSAHPGHFHRSLPPEDKVQVETDRTGEMLHAGAFVTVVGEQVQLRRADDSLLKLPLSQLEEADRDGIARRMEAIQQKNISVSPFHLAQLRRSAPRTSSDATPLIAQAFAPFVNSKAIRTHWDRQFFYVESTGIPTHSMMVGITAWQQQVPIPQTYSGANAWRVPLEPVPAKNPRSTNGDFLRGAIALAVNGVPIFNPLNNRGDDAYLFGELDEYGGHCGRADDYHYHIAPVHLQKLVGREVPIAYALDGYPVYGYEEPDGSPVRDLDEFNGHADSLYGYHYHATKKYPYLNGGFHGEVTEREGQVDPQPRANPLRPALPPLRDAKITKFVENQPGSFRLTYEVNGRPGTVAYTLGKNGSAEFVFVDSQGRQTSATYPQNRGARRPPSERPRPVDKETVRQKSQLPQLEVTSNSIDAEGRLDIDCSCDGAGQPPELAWTGAPRGTACFAISLWHTAPDQEKSYWLIYNIPRNVTKLGRNSQQTGAWGLNDKRRAAYDPMCSKGPGMKTYHVTIYALSSEVNLAPRTATRASLLAAIKDITLAEGTLDFNYERATESPNNGNRSR